MNPLEKSYRRLLHAYPVEWREERGEEMLAVLLEWAPDHRSRPTAREALDLIWNGLRARFGGGERSGPRLLAERVSILSLAGGAAVSLMCLVFGEIPRQVSPVYREMITMAPVYSLGTLLYVTWFATIGLLAVGVIRNARRVARVLLGVTGLVTLTSIAAHWSIMAAPPLGLMAFMALLATSAVGAPKTMTRGARRSLGIATVAAGAVVTNTWFDVRWGMISGGFDFYHGALPGWVHQSMWVVLPVLVVGGAVASIRRPGWLLACVLASVPWVCYQLAYLSYQQPDLFLPKIFLAGVGVVALLLKDAMRAAVQPRRVPLR
jgi:hypothetical protein